jgi:threonine dehydrogenase-like Zn-dependent dehydrogenase
MKAVVWQGGKRFALEETEMPRPGARALLVHVDVTLVCGSDLHLDDWDTEPPVIPGHEASGTVVEVGAEALRADGSKPVAGERVALDPVQVCGSCYACTHGIPHLCTRCRHLGGSAAPGTWAEYVAVDAANAHRVPEGVSMESASMVEPCAVCLESFRRAGMRSGDGVLVIGDGPFGFLHAQIARILGAGALVVAGHYDARLRRIRAATGAATCNTHHEELRELVRREAGDDGLDIVVEASGAGPSPNLGLPLLRPRGTFVVFSYIWHPEVLDMGLIGMKELNIVGSCRSLEGFDTCLGWMASRKLDPAALLDLRVPLADYERALGALRADKASIFKAALIP